MHFSTDELSPQNERTLYQQTGAQLLVQRIQGGGIAQGDAAKVAGCCIDTYRKWERGYGAPDLVQAHRLKQAFGWDIAVG